MTPELASSAGALLRAAREKQGLHIAALAAALKVTPRKLEALEADRHHELDGVIFTRALAQSVCRALRIDAKPVLALLPQPDAMPLAQPDGSLNMPYKDRASRDDRPLVGTAQRLLVGAAVLLMLAAVGLFVAPLPMWKSPALAGSTPPSPMTLPSSSPAPPSAINSAPADPVKADVVSAPGTAASLAGAPASPAAASVPAAMAASVGNPAPASALAVHAGAGAGAATTAAAAVAGNVRIEASANSWVEVRDSGGRVLLSRLLAAGEVVTLDAALPAQLTVGNAAATRVALRGQPVDLSANNASNVARMELR